MSLPLSQTQMKYPANLPVKQKGVVIVIALFIVALVALISYGFMARLERDTWRLTLLLRQAEAYYTAKGSVAWAQDQIWSNAVHAKKGQLIDKLPLSSPVIQLKGMSIQSVITDAQSRFNLNNVVDEENQKNFGRLIRVLVPQLKEQEIDTISLATRDWVKFADELGSFKKYYAERVPSLTAAHRPMVSASELRLVKGMTPSVYETLKPFVIALSQGKGINVQTASIPVLMSLSPKMTLTEAEKVVKARLKTPFLAVETFLASQKSKEEIKADQLTTQSEFFLVETHVDSETQRLNLYTLLERSTNEGRPMVSILWQSQGDVGF